MATHATHAVRMGRRYGKPATRNGMATHAARQEPLCAGMPGGLFRTLCGRLWDETEAEIGGVCDRLVDRAVVTCDRCRKRLES